jgi:acyl-CoA hydrolase
MSVDDLTEARREYAQLLRLHERLSTQLRRVRDELGAPELATLLREIGSRTGSSPTAPMVEVRSAVEEALRALSVAASEAQAALTHEDDPPHVEGIGELPPTLARFLAERQRLDGFEYEVLQDEVRGWMIQWREHTPEGQIRGFGQFYERPYAWLDE